MGLAEGVEGDPGDVSVGDPSPPAPPPELVDVGELEVEVEVEVMRAFDVLDRRDVDNVERVVRVRELVREAVPEDDVCVELAGEGILDPVASLELVAKEGTRHVR